LQKAGLDVEACGITSRERRAPYFQVVTASASKHRESPKEPRR
jgi:hypothetical protein